MNNTQIAAAFVAMCNGTKEKKEIIGRNHLHVYRNYLSVDGVTLYSYSTPIAVYDGAKVVLNCSFFSASTAKHQAAINCNALNVPVCRVYNFADWGGSETALIQQAAPLYSYRKETFHDCNGKPYTRYVLRKEGENYGLHPYVKEEAAKAEADRLNKLATGNR